MIELVKTKNDSKVVRGISYFPTVLSWVVISFLFLGVTPYLLLNFGAVLMFMPVMLAMVAGYVIMQKFGFFYSGIKLLSLSLTAACIGFLIGLFIDVLFANTFLGSPDFVIDIIKHQLHTGWASGLHSQMLHL